MHTSSPQARRITRWVFTAMETLVVGVVNGTFVVRLANMQLDGLPTFGAATLALAIAITSLMFNRARAYPVGPLQRRTLLAAELCLRSTLLLVLGAVLTAMIFPFVQAAGYLPTPMDKSPTQGIPILCAFIPSPFVLAGSIVFLEAAHVVAPSLLTRLRARHVKSAVRGRR